MQLQRRDYGVTQDVQLIRRSCDITPNNRGAEVRDMGNVCSDLKCDVINTVFGYRLQLRRGQFLMATVVNILGSVMQAVTAIISNVTAVCGCAQT